MRARFGAPVVGAAADAHRLPKLDQAVKEGDTVNLGSASAQVIDTPGHTRGQITFHFPDGGVLLCGDTLFSLGCGRLIEGTPADMFASLRQAGGFARRDAGLLRPRIHRKSNARFALTVEPDNAALHARAAEVDRAARGRPADRPVHARGRAGGQPVPAAPDVATPRRHPRRKDKF